MHWKDFTTFDWKFLLSMSALLLSVFVCDQFLLEIRTGREVHILLTIVSMTTCFLFTFLHAFLVFFFLFFFFEKNVL